MLAQIRSNGAIFECPKERQGFVAVRAGESIDTMGYNVGVLAPWLGRELEAKGEAVWLGVG